ncbi:hypothetical protein EYZ11_006325 [Aspergillus tanneri]|uniref:Methylitaconate delta2-delta3-isomerase n=1 Tax=Aspergillus tanneri TaxID=1220188 RepID=A0A4V3UP88_9EURO|nr:uncharacterized protein ATNIH1004_010481 [Aspergillus tanneri]KAA8643707.1 hypothetical protein ATNIH1004_010481 [Aspergillus tanneri]THC94184.1 hypothetical protein EYZ11_006325 [Aspergillus tanneri]
MSISKEVPSSRKSLPAVWMRAGTSKGLFIHEHHLPSSQSLWAPILLSALGSADADKRQLNGVGGGTSTTSKVAVICKSARPGVDVDYTFVQVAPEDSKIDMSGNCGNIASGVGPFAVDEGLVKIAPGQTMVDVTVFNTNTQRLLVETVQITPDGKFSEGGEYSIAGVAGTASPIRIAFMNPGGSKTGKLFPSSARQELISVQSSYAQAPFTVRASLVDAANPFIFIDATSMPSVYDDSDPSSISLDIIEEIRVAGAIRMGLATDTTAARRVRGTPKIALLRSAHSDEEVDIDARAFSLGKPHPSFQLTGAVCLGAALSVPGTVAWDLRRRRNLDMNLNERTSLDDSKKPKSGISRWAIRHPGGRLDAEVDWMVRSQEMHVNSVSVFRTARRLFEGRVFY